jgi:hypothetical protein
MRKITVLACTLAVSGFVAAPAFADCQADLTAAQAAAAKVTDAAQKADAEKHLTEAKSELAKSNEMACSQHVSAAYTAMKMKPAMKP